MTLTSSNTELDFKRKMTIFLKNSVGPLTVCIKDNFHSTKLTFHLSDFLAVLFTLFMETEASKAKTLLSPIV